MRLLQRIGRLLRPALTTAQALPPPAFTPDTARADIIDLNDPAVARDPFPFYEALRAAGPVQQLPLNGGWIVLSYDGVKDAFTRPEDFSNASYRAVDPVLLGEDPPRQALIRRIVSRHFTADAMTRLEATAARTAKGLLRPEMDAVGGFSQPVSRAVAAELIGFDQATVEEVVSASAAAASAADPLAGLVGALHGFAPRAVIYRQLLRDGEGLIGEEDARSLVGLLWLASFTTTQRVIARCVLRLIEHPDVHRAIASDSALLAPFAEEVMRLHPPEHLVPRFAPAQTELAGTVVPAGATVYLCLAAANRDPAQYEAPEALRLDRANRRHFAFGGGIHHCVGAPLARRVVTSAISALLEGASTLRPLRPLEETEWFATMTALSPARLDIGL